MHVSAAIRLISRGKTVSEGDTVKFLFTDADHVNPLCRLVAFEEGGTGVNVDREKYRGVVAGCSRDDSLRSGSLGLGTGFKCTKPWIQEIWDERQMEAEMEWART